MLAEAWARGAEENREFGGGIYWNPETKKIVVRRGRGQPSDMKLDDWRYGGKQNPGLPMFAEFHTHPGWTVVEARPSATDMKQHWQRTAARIVDYPGLVVTIDKEPKNGWGDFEEQGYAKKIWKGQQPYRSPLPGKPGQFKEGVATLAVWAMPQLEQAPEF